MTAGSLFGIEAFVQKYWPWAKNKLDRMQESHRRKVEVAALVVAVFYSGYSAWNDEHEARAKAEQQSIQAVGERDEARRQLDDRTSLSQQKVIEQLRAELDRANDKIENINKKVNEHPRQRRLERDVMERISAELSKVKADIPVVYVYASSGDEPIRYAKDFVEAINSSGILSFGIMPAIGDVEDVGVMVGLKNMNNPSVSANAFIGAIKNAGIPVNIIKWSIRSETVTDFDLFIGPRP